MSRAVRVIGWCVWIGACARPTPEAHKPRAEALLSCPAGTELRDVSRPHRRHLWCERNGLAQGPSLRLFENGRQEHGAFRRDRRTGVWSTYNRAGQLVKRGRYAHDKKEGTWTIWSDEGRRLRENHYEHGRPTLAIYYDEQGRAETMLEHQDGQLAEVVHVNKDGGLSFYSRKRINECRRLAAEKLEPVADSGPAAELALVVLVDSSVRLNDELPVVLQLLENLSRSLAPEDLVGLFVIGRDPIALVSFGPLRHRSLVSPLSAWSEPGGSSRHCRALQEARRKLAGAAARSRHILLLTDRFAPVEMQYLAEPIRTAGLHLSIVDLSSGGSGPLQSIAAAAGGAFLTAPNASDLLFNGLCAESDPATCVRLGLRHFRGAGVEKDRPLGLHLLQLGCERKSSWGCARLGEARLAEGKDQGAARAFRAGCDLGSGFACWKLGKMRAAGRGASRDVARARSLFQRGCILGSSSACAERR